MMVKVCLCARNALRFKKRNEKKTNRQKLIKYSAKINVSQSFLAIFPFSTCVCLFWPFRCWNIHNLHQSIDFFYLLFSRLAVSFVAYFLSCSRFCNQRKSNKILFNCGLFLSLHSLTPQTHFSKQWSVNCVCVFIKCKRINEIWLNAFDSIETFDSLATNISMSELCERTSPILALKLISKHDHIRSNAVARILSFFLLVDFTLLRESCVRRTCLNVRCETMRGRRRRTFRRWISMKFIVFFFFFFFFDVHSFASCFLVSFVDALHSSYSSCHFSRFASFLFRHINFAVDICCFLRSFSSFSLLK